MRRPLRPTSLRWSRFCFVGLLGLCCACGRKATQQDCELIVDRNIEVELRSRGVTDTDIVSKRKEEIRPTMKEDIDRCVGKRLTDRTLACVKTAETAEQIDKCLR